VDIRRRVELAATAYADELALRSLAEITAITADQDVRIIGGQLASLLLTAFPVSGIDLRRTRDADAAITTELAVIGGPVPELAVYKPGMLRTGSGRGLCDARAGPLARWIGALGWRCHVIGRRRTSVAVVPAAGGFGGA
jgi:hypothetical protein